MRQDEGRTSVDMKHGDFGFEIVVEEVAVGSESGVVDEQPHFEVCRLLPNLFEEVVL